MKAMSKFVAFAVVLAAGSLCAEDQAEKKESESHGPLSQKKLLDDLRSE